MPDNTTTTGDDFPDGDTTGDTTDDSSTTTTTTGTVGGTYSPAVQAAIENAATRAYYQKRLELIDVPMLQLEKDKVANQAAQFAAQMAATDKRLEQLDKPMLQVHQDTLAHQIAQDASDLALKTNVSQADLALRGATLASQEGIARAGLAQSGAKSAEEMSLARAQFGEKAAQDYANQGLDSAKLIASLRGPRNAFQQQAVMQGLNANGMTRAVGAISGVGGTPGFQAPQANPQAATLQTLAEDMAGAGGVDRALSPQDLAYVAAMKNTLHPETANTRLMATMARRDANQSYGSPSAQAAMGIAQTYGAKSMGDPGVGQAMVDAYTRASQQNGAALPAQDPRTLGIYRTVGGLSASQAAKASQTAADYYTATGAAMPTERYTQMVNGMRSTGAQPAGSTDWGASGSGGFQAPDAAGATDWMGRPKGGLLHETGGGAGAGGSSDMPMAA